MKKLSLSTALFFAASTAAYAEDFVPVQIIGLGENTISVSSEIHGERTLTLLDKTPFYTEFDESQPIVTPDDLLIGDNYFMREAFFTSDSGHDNVPWPSTDYSTKVIDFSAGLYRAGEDGFESIGQMTVDSGVSFYDLTRSWDEPDASLCYMAFLGASTLIDYKDTPVTLEESFPSNIEAQDCIKLIENSSFADVIPPSFLNRTP